MVVGVFVDSGVRLLGFNDWLLWQEGGVVNSVVELGSSNVGLVVMGRAGGELDEARVALGRFGDRGINSRAAVGDEDEEDIVVVDAESFNSNRWLQ